MEVAKDASKSNRFTLDDKMTMDPKGPRGTTGPTNRERIVDELNDLMGVVDLCIRYGIIPENWADSHAQQAKGIKVMSFMKYAASLGALTPTPGGWLANAIACDENPVA